MISLATLWRTIKTFIDSDRQTKFFIFTLVIYMVAIIWTTLQAFIRIEYSHSDVSRPIVIQIQNTDSS